jgi:hypothetical protein
LIAVHARWSNDPTSFTYQWEDCNASGAACTPIAGQTGQTYAIGEADAGQTVAVLETASNAGGAGATVSSPATGPVALASAPLRSPLIRLGPVIRGQVSTGATLTASTGAWEATPPLSYTYDWRLCGLLGCTDIPGATEPSYTVGVYAPGDAGDDIQVVVTATNDVGNAVAQSGSVGPVPALPPFPRPTGGSGHQM